MALHENTAIREFKPWCCSFLRNFNPFQLKQKLFLNIYGNYFNDDKFSPPFNHAVFVILIVVPPHHTMMIFEVSSCLGESACALANGSEIKISE